MSILRNGRLVKKEIKNLINSVACARRCKALVYDNALVSSRHHIVLVLGWTLSFQVKRLSLGPR